MTSNGFIKILIRWVALSCFIVIGLFFIAGTKHLLMLNAYIVTMVPSLLVMMLAIAPQLAQQGEQAEQDKRDVRVRSSLVVFALATIVTAALDIGPMHLSNNIPAAFSIIALGMFVVASGLQAWAMSVNLFYSPIIRIQSERKHRVITRGPYRVLRHPAYFSNIVAVPASAVAIGSWVALIPAIIFCVITVQRARKEDLFLKQNLAGYKAYMKCVPWGVLPHLF
jgi:protein-S-isoprenylcysteine O-methyltransferase Ste14